LIFWIVMSILLTIILAISTFGPLIGIYGEMEYRESGDDK